MRCGWNGLVGVCLTSEKGFFRTFDDHKQKAGAVLIPDEFKRRLDAMRKPFPDTPSAV
jgi:hypothetical protein